MPDDNGVEMIIEFPDCYSRSILFLFKIDREQFVALFVHSTSVKINEPYNSYFPFSYFYNNIPPLLSKKKKRMFDGYVDSPFHFN